jgi:hypothetical protein
MPILHLHKFSATQAASIFDFETKLDSAREVVRSSTQQDPSITQHATIGIVKTSEENAFELWTEAISPDAQFSQRDLHLIEKLREIFSSHAIYTHHRIDLPTSAFDKSNNPFTSNLIEVVQNIFPAAQATPSYRERIDKDFRTFDDAYMPGASGTTGLIVGWTLDAQGTSELGDMPASCMFVIRGWDSQEAFDRSVRSEHAQKAFPIVFGWGAPHKLVSCISSLTTSPFVALTSSVVVGISRKCMSAATRRGKDEESWKEGRVDQVHDHRSC